MKYILINDNAGIIQNYHKETTSLKGWRVCDYKQHEKEECRLSFKIAKINHEMDKNNQYYKMCFDKAKNYFKKYEKRFI
jgi:hypothetical protein